MKPRVASVVFALAVVSFLTILQLDAAVKYGYWTPASYLYDYHTLSTSQKSAVSYGSSRWNVSGSTFEWIPDTTSSNDRDVYMSEIDGAFGTAGVTLNNRTNSSGTIISTGQITSMNIKFDSEENWYTGTGTPTSTQLDMRSVAAHEFGHALGLAHTQITNCGAESTSPTMCGTPYPYGKTWMRSLQPDDLNGVRSIYPASSLREPSIKIANDQSVTVHFDYRSLSAQEAIKAASQVVQGVITDISPTRWNQDSGEYWEDLSEDGTTRYVGLPYFTVTLSEASDLMGYRSPLTQELAITVLGLSPLDVQDKHEFQIGDELIALVRHTKLAWRDGKRPIIQFVGEPAQSHFYKADNGMFYRASDRNHEKTGLFLDELQDLVRRIHPTPEKE